MIPFIVILTTILIITVSVQPCDQTPYRRISDCNITCNQCTSWNVCHICPTQLRINSSTSQCVLPTQYTTIYFQDLFSPNFVINQSNKFQVDQENAFTTKNLTSEYSLYQTTICSPGDFKFNVFGFMNQQQYINFNYEFGYQVSHIQVRFRLISLKQLITIQIAVNNHDFYSQILIATQSDLLQANSSSLKRIVQIPQLNINTAKSLLIPIRSGTKSFSGDTMKMVIQVLQNQNRTNLDEFYAIYEFILIARMCQTCISITLLGSSASLGIAFGIAFAILLGLSLILIIIIKMRDHSVLTKLKNKQGFVFKNRIIQKLTKSKIH